MHRYLTPEQAAERLPFGNPDWIRAQLRAGRLRGSKIGGRWLVEPAALDDMVAAGSNQQVRRRRRRSPASPLPPGVPQRVRVPRTPEG